jgi:hypothetical protein
MVDILVLEYLYIDKKYDICKQVIYLSQVIYVIKVLVIRSYDTFTYLHK